MRLKVLAPTRVVLEREVDKVTGEDEWGAFGLLPRHVDFVTALVPGILGLVSRGEEEFLAVDGGLLTKVGDTVTVSTAAAVYGGSLEELRRTVIEEFEKLDERRKKARSAAARIESHLVRRFMDL